MKFIFSGVDIDSLTGKSKDDIILVGDRLCPVMFFDDKSQTDNYVEQKDHIKQMPIYPNSALLGALNLGERFDFSVNEIEARKLAKLKGRVLFGLDLLLRWGKKQTGYERFAVVGLYKKSEKEYYYQRLTFERRTMSNIRGCKLVSYQECEISGHNFQNDIGWIINDGLLKPHTKDVVEHVFIAGNIAFEKINFLNANDLRKHDKPTGSDIDETSNISFVGVEAFAKRNSIPLKLKSSLTKVPLVASLALILGGAGLFFGSQFYFELQLDGLKETYKKDIVGIEQIYDSSEQQSSSINLIQQREYYLESLSKYDSPTMYITKLLQALNTIRNNGLFKDAHLSEMLFNRENASFTFKVTVPSSKNIAANEQFLQFIESLGSKINVPLHSVAPPQKTVIDTIDNYVFHVGGAFNTTFTQ